MRRNGLLFPLYAVVALAVAVALWNPVIAQIPVVGEQTLLKLRTVNDLGGAGTANGSGVLNVGEGGVLSAAVASATRAEVVAAPAAGLQVFLRGVWVEKATASTGSVVITEGTGTNCGTGPVVKLTIGAGSPAIGYYPVNALITAAKAVCITTDAATTSARVLTN